MVSGTTAIRPSQCTSCLPSRLVSSQYYHFLSLTPWIIAANSTIVKSTIDDSKTYEPFDKIITVCDTAAEACPIFPGAVRRRHWSFEDPSKATGSEAEQLAVYRRVRDKIKSKIEEER